MANITTDNINTIASQITSLDDGDYIYVYKSTGQSMGRITKAQLLQGLSSLGGGGMSSQIYQAIQTNIEAIRSVLYGLINTYLANLAFNNGKPTLTSIESAFEWPAQSSGSNSGSNSGNSNDTPTATPELISPTNNSTINIGTNTGDGVSKMITVQGSNLTETLSVSVSGTGFSVYPSEISSQMANSGTQIIVTYNGTTDNATGTLTISSSTEVNISVNLTARYEVDEQETIVLRTGYTFNGNNGNLVQQDSSSENFWSYTETYIEIPSGTTALFWHHGRTSTANSGSASRSLIFYSTVKSKIGNKAANSDDSSNSGWRKIFVPSSITNNGGYVRASFVGSSSAVLTSCFIKSTTNTLASNDDAGAKAISDSDYSNYLFNGGDTSTYEVDPVTSE